METMDFILQPWHLLLPILAGNVPMTVLAFLTDPEVVVKILRHLGLPTVTPAHAAAGGPAPAFGFARPEEDARPADVNEGGEAGPGEPPTRPPP